MGYASTSYSIWKILRIRPHSAFGNFTTMTRMKPTPSLTADDISAYVKEGCPVPAIFGTKYASTPFF